MEVSAKLRFARISPQKARLVAGQIRGLPVDRALEVLMFSQKKASGIVKKILESAIANAENNEGADIDELSISKLMVDQAPTMKRMRPRAKGRANRIIKRTSHITLTVSDGQV